jgi:hypothetical protein
MNRRSVLLLFCMGIAGCGERGEATQTDRQTPTTLTDRASTPTPSSAENTVTSTRETERETTTETPSTKCSPPDAKRDPIELLPDVSGRDEWTLVDTYREAAGMINADAGTTRVYENGEGFEYSVSAYRFPSEEAARDGMATFSGNQMFAYWLVLGNHGLAAGGNGKDPDRDGIEETPLPRDQEKAQARVVLSLSPVLTEQCLESVAQEVAG